MLLLIDRHSNLETTHTELRGKKSISQSKRAKVKANINRLVHCCGMNRIILGHVTSLVSSTLLF